MTDIPNNPETMGVLMALANRDLLPLMMPSVSASTEISCLRSALILEMVLGGVSFLAVKGTVRGI